jgi:gamma-glutamyltranspeptidase / glutathione hydrolase
MWEGKRAGEVVRNAELARALQRVAEHGRDGFYKGETAQAIVDAVPFMKLDDLGDFQPEWVEPLHVDYRGWTVFELPPNGQGIAALEMLRMLEQFPLREWGFHSARTLHAMIEAKKLAYADMHEYVGDPKFSPIPVQQLLDGAPARAKLIDMQKAACAVAPAQVAAGADTIYLSVADAEGNIVSLIQSNYSAWGSGVQPRGMGFWLQNRGALFTLMPGKANTLGPHKRPLHTIIPAFMQKGDTRIGFGIMGGWNQAQAHAQFVADIADFGMTIQQALEAGRFTKATFDGCDVEIESSVPSDVRDELTKLGHQLTVRPLRTDNFGFGQAVLFDRKSGVKFGASDPRHDGEAIPVPAPYFK